jgi:glycine/D-amino acid oxidase-like deaminating enzyme
MNDYDVVIVGGGAAGLSAALVLSRARRAVAVVDAGAPRNAPAAHMHGFLSRDGLPPASCCHSATARSSGTAANSSPTPSRTRPLKATGSASDWRPVQS